MYSILIIDDEPIVKIALRSILPWEEHGFSICGTASNGLEAMSLIEKHQPDVIITDLKMPEMDGLELIRTLKEKNIPERSSYSAIMKILILCGAHFFWARQTIC